MALVDSHFHPQLLDEDISDVIKSANEEGVGQFIAVAITPQDTDYLKKIANQFANVYFSYGVHPHYIDDFRSIHIPERWPKLVAIGEIGLDYSFNKNNTNQIDYFAQQMEFAKRLSLPVIIHSRNAESDTLSVMKSFPTVKGVLHCFTNSLTMAMEAIQLGYYISFSGIVTFTNARALHSVAAAIPLQSIIIETDSPYLTPHPFRGKTANHPKYLKYVAHKIAQLHNVTYDIVTKLTTKNSQQLFALAEQ